MSRFGFEVIDADGHVVETRPVLARQGWSSAGTDLIDALLSWTRREDWGDRLRPEVNAGAFEPTARLRDMDREGIDVAVNYPTALLGVSDFPDVASSVEACRAFNDWFAGQYHAAAPERLFAAAIVPLGDGDAAAAEVRRAVGELGAVGVMVQPYAGDRHLCDPALDALWAAAQDLDAPIAVHGSRHTCPPHLRVETFRNQARFYALSHPFQQQVAMGDLVLGGVLERFPTLKVVFLESGVGWMPHFIDRLDEAYASVREDWTDGRYELARPPHEYLLSGQCWFSCEPDEPNLAAAVGYLGAEQVLYASDYPHFDCSFPDSVEELVDDSGLDTAVVRKVAGANARALYRLEARPVSHASR
ncbi:MAG TPA: amidohydrolase family protein [Acidimicrobiia bacterium]